MEYLQVQLIEPVFARKGEDIDKILWDRKKILEGPMEEDIVNRLNVFV